MVQEQHPQEAAETKSTVQSVFYKNVKIVYDSFGDGNSALVFVHGWLCSRALWLHQAPLYTGYRSILIDLPGHGQSDKPHIDYNMELFARSVKAVLDAENVSRAVLVGHSMGGPVSTMFLRLFPNSVSGIIYLDSFWQTPESYLTIEQRMEIATHRADDINFKAKVDTLFGNATPQAVKDSVTQVMMATAKHVRLSACTAHGQPHSISWDTTFLVPALHLAAEGVQTDQYWHHHMPALEVREHKGLGHFLFMEDSTGINSEIRSFIADNKLLP